MSAARLAVVLVLVAAGAATSVVFAAKAAHWLHHAGTGREVLARGPGTAPDDAPAASAGSRAPRHGTERDHERQTSRHGSSPASPTDRHDDAPDPSAGAEDAGGVLGLGVGTVLVIAAIELVAGVLGTGLLLGVLAVRRTFMRARRDYALYELHLSPHDEAKAQDLEDMIEAIANTVRAWPAERIRNGQPYLALELVYGAGSAGMEWSINLRCQPATAAALDAAISAAYPDVRLGHRHGTRPIPRPGTLLTPGCVLRFRKERSFVYPLIAAGEAKASPPLEQIALAQVGHGEPSVVRFQLTPTPAFFEELARKLYKRHENKLVRQERWGLPEGGLWSTLNRAEMGNAQRTQNRSLFWMELQVAADSAQACKTIAAAVQSRRGENRLHRRWMPIRAGLYRRRFPRALGPLLPSWRSLVSAAEVAHLLALPSARMKGVPVRRLALPRIPMPPEVRRADDDNPRWTPPAAALTHAGTAGEHRVAVR